MPNTLIQYTHTLSCTHTHTYSHAHTRECFSRLLFNAENKAMKGMYTSNGLIHAEQCMTEEW